jgi:polyphosphate kinase 2 (PPK2 family)
MQENNSFEIDGEMISLEDLINTFKESKKQQKDEKKAIKKHNEEKELKPFQAELIKLQRHIEDNNQKMIILFEGRDAAGKGGTIRRVTRYMNEKHYRVVALGKPTEEQRTQWFYQKYIQHFPRGGEIVLFDRSWYNRAMVEDVFGFLYKKRVC